MSKSVSGNRDSRHMIQRSDEKLEERVNRDRSATPQVADFTFVATGPDHFGLLPDEALKQWQDVEKSGKDWAAMTAREQELARRALGCLEKLSISLLQCDRIRTYHDWIIGEAKRNARESSSPEVFQVMEAWSGSVAIADFESLLLQSRACLDRLALYITSDSRNHVTSYSKLINVLQNSGKIPTYLELARIHSTSADLMSGLVVKTEGKENSKSFRDLIAHREAAIERVSSCFAISLLENRRALIFDCELWNFGVFETAIRLGQNLAYLVLNSLALLKSVRLLPIEAYALSWRNRSVLLRDFVIDEKDNAPLGPYTIRYVTKMVPGGVVLATRNVKPELFEKSIFLD